VRAQYRRKCTAFSGKAREDDWGAGNPHESTAKLRVEPLSGHQPEVRGRKSEVRFDKCFEALEYLASDIRLLTSEMPR